MRLLIILLLITSTSCMTKRRAINMIEKVQENYPELLAFDTTIVDTIYCDTIQLSFEVPCDTLIKLVAGDTLYLDSIIYVKDSSGTITASRTVIPKPQVITRTIKQTLKPACPPHKKKDFDIFLWWSGLAFWLSLILIILRWLASMK